MDWQRAFFFLFLLSGCMHGIYHDRRLNDAHYHSGRGYPSLRAESNANGTSSLGVTDKTMLGLVASAFTLAQNPDYYRKSTIGGRCVYASSLQGLEMPCVNTTVALLDSQGRECDRVFSADGSFEFLAEKNRDYQLTIFSERYRMDPEVLGPVSMGDDVVIRLSRRHSASR